MATKFSQHAWDELIARYPRGTILHGTVRDQQPYGVWVTLDELPDVPALLELIHFAINETNPAHRIRFSDDFPPLGLAITARVLAWSEHPRDVRLTQLSHLRWVYDRT